MSGICPGPRPGRRRLYDIHRVVERILTDGPRPEDCETPSQFQLFRRLWAWEQDLRHGPKVADMPS